MKNSPIKLIVFDFNGVMTTGSYWNIARELARTEHDDAQTIYDVFYKYHNLGALKKIPETEMFPSALRDLGYSLDVKKVERRHLVLTSVANKSVMKYAASLRKRGFTVIGLSKNVPFIFNANLKFSGAAKYFDEIINTYDLNLPKASQKTIKLLMKRFGLHNASEMILIDDQENNLVEAARMGAHIFLYKNFKAMRLWINNIISLKHSR